MGRSCTLDWHIKPTPPPYPHMPTASPVVSALYPNGLRSVRLTHPLTGDAPHTLAVNLSFPSYQRDQGPKGATTYSKHRLWLLQMGQIDVGSEHWIISNDGAMPVQFGVFCGAQIHNVSAEVREPKNQRQTLLVRYDGTDYQLYRNGRLEATVKGVVFDFYDAALLVGEAAKQDGCDFDGLVYSVQLWDRVLSEDEMRAAVWENKGVTGVL